MSRLLRRAVVAAGLLASVSKGSGADAASYLAVAQQAMEAHDSALAKAQIALALKAMPDSAQAWLMLATIESQDGEPSAIPHYRKALSLAPNSFSGHYNLALAYLRDHQLQAAGTQLETAVSLKPNQPDAAYNLGMVLLEMKQAPIAIAWFQRAQHLEPVRPDIAFNLIRATLEAGKLDAARLEIERLEAVPALRPVAEDAKRLLAAAYLESKQPERVTTLIDTPQSSQDRFLRAQAFFAQRQWAEALGEVSIAMRQEPREPRYLLLAARLDQSLGRQEPALELLRQASELAPEQPDIPYAAAVSYYFEQRYEDSRHSLDRGLQLAPECSRCLFLFGVGLVNEGRNEEALSYLRRAIKTSPESARYHFHLGTALARANRPAEAKSVFEKAIRLSPNYALPHYELGKLLSESGDATRAVGEYEAAIRCDPGLAQAYYQLGRQAARMGQTQKSEQILARFRELKKQANEDQVLADDVAGELRHP